jgi:signal transduction histidine kinase
MVKGAKVLVVDDSQTSRMALAFGLQYQGHEVVEAKDGQEALEIVRTTPFDLMLLDVEMPILDGYQVLEQMKNDPTLRDIPVIVISAVDDTESVVKCIQMGAEDYLFKPFDPVLLKARIEASLEKKRWRNQELEYLHQVSQLTDAAAAVETETFDPESLSGVAARTDALGQLARIFQRMAGEVRAREEGLKQQNKVKSAFIGVITHELRSPFVSAALSVELLQRYVENKMFDELKEQVQQLDQELSSGRRMINTVISFANLVHQRGNLNRHPLDFESLVREAVKPLLKFALSRQVELRLDLPAENPPISVDKEQLREAIYHLVHNAIKFNQEGGSVWISSALTDEALTFEVSDTGVGLPSEKLETIWEAFTQTADDVQRGIEGLGLGLALVKLSVEGHGGHVMVNSQPNEGSTFGFCLPLNSDLEGNEANEALELNCTVLRTSRDDKVVPLSLPRQ